LLVLCLAIIAAACGDSPASGPLLTPTTRYDLVWRDSLHSAVTRPVVDDSTAYFVDRFHVVTALDKRTGRLRWQTTFSSGYDEGFRTGLGMAIAGGNLIVGDVDVAGLDRATGTVKWRFSPTPLQHGHSHLTSDGTTVYTGSLSGRVYAIDAATGAERWRTSVAESTFVVNDPILVDGVIYLALSMVTPPYGGGVAAVRANDGQRLWITMFPSDPQHATGVETGVGVSDALVVAGALDDRVVALDRTTGAVRLTIPGSSFRYPGIPSPLYGSNFVIASSRQTVVVASLFSGVVGLDGNDGHVRWSNLALGGAVLDVSIVDDRVYLAASLVFDAFRIADGSIAWSIPAADFPNNVAPFDWFSAAPAVDADRVYLGGDHGLYAFKKR
jgi:outer membrane protein assembly factor BamB